MCYMNSWYWGHGVFWEAFICLCICVFVVVDTCVCANLLYNDLVFEPCDEVSMEAMRSLSGWLCREDGL